MSARTLETYKVIAAAIDPPTSPYWLAGAEEFYTGSQLERIECVGRGGDKSRDIVRSAIAETIAGEFQIPAGERHYFIIVSENVAEATKTLRLLEAYLKTLGIAHERSGDTVELQGMPRGIRVLACRVGAVSGYRAYGWAADEAAKWKNTDGVNNAREVVASIRAMCVTHPTARGRMYSSPLGCIGFFPESLAIGTNERQLVRRAPTWVANPSVTEARTRELEPHEPTWRREYMAIPSDGGLGVFDLEDFDLCVEHELAVHATVSEPIVLYDSNAGAGVDRAAWALAAHMHRLVPVDTSPRFGWDERGNPIELPPLAPKPRARLAVWGMRATAERLKFDEVDALVARDALAVGARFVVGDQHMAFAHQAEFARHKLVYVPVQWTAPRKQEAVRTLRQMMRDRVLALEPGNETNALRREVATFEESITAAGTLRYNARSGAHDDRLALLMNAAMVEAGLVDLRGVPGMPGSPYRRSVERHELLDYEPGYEDEDDYFD